MKLINITSNIPGKGTETYSPLNIGGCENTNLDGENANICVGAGNLPSTSRLAPEKRKHTNRIENNTANDHDGDVEDISDGERTSSEHGMFYNNISPSTPK